MIEEMTDKQASRYEDLARFYELQKAIDKMKDGEQKELLEAQKKELIDRLETR